MSIENKLKYDLKTEASKLETPPYLDAAILRNYRKQVMGNRSEKMNVKSLYKKAITIAAIVVVLCGFGYGAKQLFSTSSESMTLNIFSTNEFEMSEQELKNTYLAVQEVKSQLNVGEHAVLYRPTLNEKYPIVAVSQPEKLTAWDEWAGVLHSEKVKVHEQLSNGSFTFKSGIYDDPYYTFLPNDQEDYIDDLKAQYSEKKDNSIIWKKVKVVPEEIPLKTYSTEYINNEGLSIYVVASIMDSSIIKVDSFINNEQSLITKQIGDKEVSFVRNKQALTSTGQLQSVTWLESVEQGTIMYNIISEHQNIQDKILFNIAEQIIAE